MGFRGYLELAGFILAVFFICAALYLWRDKDNALAALLAAQTQIHDKQGEIDGQKVTIAHLTDYKAANDNLLAAFMLEVKGIGSKYATMQNDIANLRRTNADVEKYLSLPIPPALADLLNRGVQPVSATGAPAAAQGR